MSKYYILDSIASAQEPEVDGAAILKLAEAAERGLFDKAKDRAGAAKESVREKLLDMLGGERKKPKESRFGFGLGTGSAGAGAGTALGAKYHKELEELLAKIKQQGASAMEKAKSLFQKHDKSHEIGPALRERMSFIGDGIPDKSEQVKSEITQALKKMHSIKDG